MSETELRPYAVKFWYRPGAVLAALLQAQQGHRLALLAGAAFGLVQVLPLYLKPEAASGWILPGGLLLGVGAIYFFSWLLRNFARWFGGQGTLCEVRTGLGLGLLPWTLLFVALIPLSGGLDAAHAWAQLYWLIFAFFVYGYVVLLLSLSAALRLSPVKTFFCLVVTLLVSIFPLSLAAQLLLQRAA